METPDVVAVWYSYTLVLNEQDQPPKKEREDMATKVRARVSPENREPALFAAVQTVLELHRECNCKKDCGVCAICPEQWPCLTVRVIRDSLNGTKS